MAYSNDYNLGLYYGWDYSEDGWNTGMDENMLILGGMACLSVVSRTITTVPSSPTDGDVYYIPDNATGAWSAYLESIAIYSSFESGWLYVSVKSGWQFRVQDETGSDGQMLSVFFDGDGLVESIDSSGYVKDSSSYTATGDIEFTGAITYTGTHSADTSELATMQDVDDAVGGQNFDNVATLDGDNSFTGSNSFTQRVSGIDATSDDEFATKGQMDTEISNITMANTSGGSAGVYKDQESGQFNIRSFTSLDASVTFDDSFNDEYVDLSINFPSAGASTFVELTDTPTEYASGDAGKVLVVNGDEDAIEFTELTTSIEVYDEGNLVGSTYKINFIGDDVGAYLNGDTIDIYIPDVNFYYTGTSVSPSSFTRGQDMTGETIDVTWQLSPASASIDSQSVTGGTLGSITPIVDEGSNNYSVSDFDVSGLDTTVDPQDETLTFLATSTSFGSANTSASISLTNYIYFGRSSNDTLTESEVESLTDGTGSPYDTNDHTTTYSFAEDTGAGDTYLYICYPTRLGLLTTWDDGSQFGVTTYSPIDVVSVRNSEATPYTEDYYIQRSANTLAAAYSITTS